MSAHKTTVLAPDSIRRLDVYQVTLQLISRCKPHRKRLKRLGRRMETQLNCALASTLQNLAEGMRRTGKDRAYLLSVALGNCDEVRAILEAAVAFGVVSTRDQQQHQKESKDASAMRALPRSVIRFITGGSAAGQAAQ